MTGALRSYRSSLILLAAVIAGGAAGAYIGPAAVAIEPVGTLFLNLLFSLVVPLVFFGVASAVAAMGSPRRLGRILGHGLAVFAATSFLAAALGLLGARLVDPTRGMDRDAFRAAMAAAPAPAVPATPPSLLRKAVDAVSVPDFAPLLTRQNMLPLLVFAVLTGFAAASAGESLRDGNPARPFVEFLAAGAAVTNRMVDLVMRFAPLGLACYFASVAGQLGPQILAGYLAVFLLHLGLSAVYLVVFLPAYAWLAAGRPGVRALLAVALEPSVTALATCSSAASIPANLAAAAGMGVPADVVETIVPLGANLHKDGTVMGGVMKLVFLLSLFGMDWTGLSASLGILVVAVLVGAVMGAIPGGGMIGEMLIVSVYGFSPAVLPVIAIISTVIDAPATLINVVGDLPCALWVARRVEGSGWRPR